MIINFIKEIRDFYFEVYKTDLKSLSVQDLQSMQSHFKSFYSNPILLKKDSEQDKLYNFLAFKVLSLYSNFCLKDEYCNYYLGFIDEVIHSLEENPHSLNDIVLTFCSNIKIPIGRIIKNTTIGSKGIYNIIFNSDLDTYNYLYYYGENITDNHIKIVDYFNSINDDKLTSMAKCVIDSFLRGLEKSSIDVSKKDYTLLFYPIGFEKLVKKISYILDGKLKVAFRIFESKFDKQLSYNHRYDYNFYLNKEYINNYLSYFKEELVKNVETYSRYAGPIYIETFGENRFIPQNGDEVFEKDKELATLNSSFDTDFTILYEEYVRKNTSFTIISYPCPEIGKDFESIFDETIKLNTLDNAKYKKIHQSIIDVLDTAKKVHITGRNGNKTDLTVALSDLTDAKSQTLFENCCADVNVPVR